VHEDSDDYGYIEIVKFWCEDHGYAVELYEGNEDQFVILGSHCDEFNRGKNELWTRLNFKLHVAPRLIFDTLALIKSHYQDVVILPTRTEDMRDRVISMRRDSALRLWIDRRAASRAKVQQTRPTTRSSAAAAVAAAAAAAAAVEAEVTAPTAVRAGIKRKSDECGNVPVPVPVPVPRTVVCSPSNSDSATTADDESESVGAVHADRKRRVNAPLAPQLECDEEIEFVDIVGSGDDGGDAEMQPTIKWREFFVAEHERERANQAHHHPHQQQQHQHQHYSNSNQTENDENENDNANHAAQRVGASFLADIFNAIRQN
jgi:hypothetical protein